MTEFKAGDIVTVTQLVVTSGTRPTCNTAYDTMKVVRRLQAGDFVKWTYSSSVAIVRKIEDERFVDAEYVNGGGFTASMSEIALATSEEFEMERKEYEAQRRNKALAAMQELDLDTLIDEIIRRKEELKKRKEFVATLTSGSDNTQIGYKAK